MRAGICAAVLIVLGTPLLADPEATRALNDFRGAEGRFSLAYSMQLETAARAHAQDMATAGFFSHEGSDGSDVSARVRRTGYRWCLVAENIAKGQRNLDEVMTGWADSPGHRSNMLSRDVAEFALVRASGDIWVMVLAAPGC